MGPQSIEHRRAGVDPDDVDPAVRQRQRQPSGAHGQLEHPGRPRPGGRGRRQAGDHVGAEAGIADPRVPQVVDIGERVAVRRSRIALHAAVLPQLGAEPTGEANNQDGRFLRLRSSRRQCRSEFADLSAQIVSVLRRGASGVPGSCGDDTDASERRRRHAPVPQRAVRQPERVAPLRPRRPARRRRGPRPRGRRHRLPPRRGRVHRRRHGERQRRRHRGRVARPRRVPGGRAPCRVAHRRARRWHGRPGGLGRPSRARRPRSGTGSRRRRGQRDGRQQRGRVDHRPGGGRRDRPPARPVRHPAH